jgi:tRNA 2-thiocytidine biosynthesis protein TtcA
MAIGDFNMIHDGDRVLVGLSGGKDSMTMLHVLHTLQKKAPIKYVCHALYSIIYKHQFMSR